MGSPGQTGSPGPKAGPGPLDALLAEHNDLLASAGISLRLERRGERLGLRGPLPCRQGRDGLPVQRISLGVPATAEGLEQAKLQLSRQPRPLPTMNINPAVRCIFDFKYEDFTLQGYDPHPGIKAPIAV